MGFSCSERLTGIYLVPHPWLTMPSWPMVEQIARVGLTALAAPPDFLALDKVATVVQERYTQVLWIRLQTADADPGALLVTLLGAATRLDARSVAGDRRGCDPPCPPWRMAGWTSIAGRLASGGYVSHQRY